MSVQQAGSYMCWGDNSDRCNTGFVYEHINIVQNVSERRCVRERCGCGHLVLRGLVMN